MTNVKVHREGLGVLSQEEIDGMHKKAEKLPTEYFRLRAKSLVSTFRTGKRVGEVCRVGLGDISTDQDWLYVTFSLEKKRKKNPYTTQATKKFRLKSKDAQNILTLKSWLQDHIPNCKYLYPSGHSVFGQGYIIYGDVHLNVRQVRRIIQILNPNAWPHLFRETRGAQIVKADEATFGEAKLETVWRVKNSLNLEREETAYRYIRRYASEKIESEDETIS